MTSKERLTAALRGEPADRPGISFYEVGGFCINPDDPDPYNIYNSDSWRELLAMAEEETDIIRMMSPCSAVANPIFDDFFKVREYEKGNSRFKETVLTAGGRQMTSLTRRDKDLDTIWTVKHLLDDREDLKAFLQLPDELFLTGQAYAPILEEEKRLGDRGLVMIDTGDPLCRAADLFEFGNYTIMALTEQDLFHRLLEKFSRPLYKNIEETARTLPGRLWRIYGPEYASEPYLPPRLFKEYVNRYTGPMVEMIQKQKGIVRLHSHGRLKNNLDAIADMGVDALDPIEPPPQGDTELSYIAENYGEKITLFGNVEVADIENLAPGEFREKTVRSIDEGRKARGFVLMPSSSPYGREISEQTMKNYRTMVELINS